MAIGGVKFSYMLESSGKHQSLFLPVTKNRVPFLILLWWFVLTLPIYNCMKQENNEDILPVIAKALQRDSIAQSENHVNVHQKQKVHTKTIYKGKRFKREIRIIPDSDDPTLFSGDLDDIPEKVIVGVSGTVISVDNVPLMWRPRISRSICYHTCKEEIRIDCVQYYYDKSSRKCYLIGKKTSVVPLKIHIQQVTARRPRPKPTTPPTVIQLVPVQKKSNDLSDLIIRIKNVQDEFQHAMATMKDGKETHETIIQGLQAKQNVVKGTIDLLSDKVKNLNKVNHRMVDKINVMDSEQETLVDQVQNMGSYEQKIAGALSNVDKKVTNIDADLNAIKLANEKVTKQLRGEEVANPEFNREIIALKRQVIDLMSRVEVNPTVLKLTKNQRVLAEALEAVDREIAINERRLAHIDESTDDWGGRLMAEEEHRKALSDAMQTLSKAVKDVRNDVTLIQNPQSAENIQKAKQIRELQSDVDFLEKSNSKLKQDVAHARADMTRLVKDLVNVQVSAHDSKTSIFALVEANKNLALEYRQLKMDQNQMITQIQTLATVYRSVLAALHSLELKQIQVMHQLGRYETDMRRVSAEVLAAKANAKKEELIHNTPLINSMKNFQMKLLKQVNQLQQDLLKIQNYVKENPPKHHIQHDEHIIKVQHEIRVAKHPQEVQIEI